MKKITRSVIGVIPWSETITVTAAEAFKTGELTPKAVATAMDFLLQRAITPRHSPNGTKTVKVCLTLTIEEGEHLC